MNKQTTPVTPVLRPAPTATTMPLVPQTMPTSPQDQVSQAVVSAPAEGESIGSGAIEKMAAAPSKGGTFDGTGAARRAPGEGQVDKRVSLARGRQQSRATETTKVWAGLCDSGHLTSPREMGALDEPLAEQDLSNTGAIDRLLMNKQDQVVDGGRDSQTHKAQSSQTGVQSIEQLKSSQVLNQHDKQEFMSPSGQGSLTQDQARWQRGREQLPFRERRSSDMYDLLDSADRRAYQKKEQVAIYGQSFKINLKLRNRGKHDAKMENMKQATTRENRSPGTALISRNQTEQLTDNSYNNSRMNTTKNNSQGPVFAMNQAYHAKRRLLAGHVAEQCSVPIGATVPHPSILKNRAEIRKGGSSIGKFVPQQQQSVKHGAAFYRQVNVLLPTQYQPQLDVMLNQNAALMARRAQEANRNQYLRNKYHNQQADLQTMHILGSSMPNRPRTIEDSRKKKAEMRAPLGEEGAPQLSEIVDTLPNQQPEPQNNVSIQNQDNNSSLSVIEEINKQKHRASGVTKSAEGQLPTLKSEDTGEATHAGGAPVRVQIVSGNDQQQMSLASSKEQQFRASPNFTLKHTSRAENSQMHFDGTMPMSKLISQSSLPQEVEAAMRSSQGCKTTQSELKTVFTQKFEATDGSQPRKTVVASKKMQKGQKSSLNTGANNQVQVAPEYERLPEKTSRGQVRRVNFSNRKKDSQHHEKIYLQESELMIENERQSNCSLNYPQPNQEALEYHKNNLRMHYNGPQSTKKAQHLRPLDQMHLPDLANRTIPSSSMQRMAARQLQANLFVLGSSKAGALPSPPQSTQDRSLHAQDALGLDPHFYYYKGKYQNSFFNRQFEKILLKKMMKGLAKQVDEAGNDSRLERKQAEHQAQKPLEKDDQAAPGDGKDSQEKKVNRFDGGNALLCASLDEVLQDSENLEDAIESNAMSIQQYLDQKDHVETARLTSQQEVAKADPSDFKKAKQLVTTYIEQNDQVLAKKQNQYYKQLKSLQQDGQEIVISHPYDLSHLVNAEKSFMTTSNLIKRRKEFTELKKLRQIRHFDSFGGGHRQVGRLLSHANQAEPTSPKKAKELWMKRAYESTQQGLICQQNTDRVQKRSALPNQRAQKLGKTTLFDTSRSPLSRMNQRTNIQSIEASYGDQAIRQQDLRQSRNQRLRLSPRQDEEQLLGGFYEKDIINFNSKKPLNHPRPYHQYTSRSHKYQNMNSTSPSSRLQETAPQQRSERASPLSIHKGHSRNYGGHHIRRFEPINDFILEQNKEQDFSTNNRTESIEVSISPRGKQRRQNKVYIQGILGPHAQDRTVEKLATSKISTYQEYGGSMHLGEQSGHGRQIAYSNIGSPRKRKMQEQQILLAERSRHKDDRRQKNERRQTIGLRTSIQGVGLIESLDKLNSTPKDCARSGWGRDQQSMTLVSDYVSTGVDKSKHKSIEDPGASFAIDEQKLSKQSNKQEDDGLVSQETFNKRDTGGHAGVLSHEPSQEPKGLIGIQNPIYHKVSIAHQQPSQLTTKADKQVSSPSFLHINQVVLQSRNDDPFQQQSPRRQFVSRKQTKGYAGGVIGSGVDASMYLGSTSPKNLLMEKKRPKTKDGNRRVSNAEQILVQNFQQQHAFDELNKSNEGVHYRNQNSLLDDGKGRNTNFEFLSMQQNPTLGAPFFGWPQETESSQPFSSPKSERSRSPHDEAKPTPKNYTLLQAQTYKNGRGNPVLGANIISSTKINESAVAEVHSSLPSRDLNNSAGTDNCSGHGQENFKPLNTKEIRLNCRIKERQYLEGERKRISSQQTINRKSPTASFNHDKVIKVLSMTTTQRRHIHVQENTNLEELTSSERPLDDYTVQILRQRTLYKMQKHLWYLYELEWNRFKKQDHVHAQAPIPPNCRILPFHIYLTNAKMSLRQLKAHPPAQEQPTSPQTDALLGGPILPSHVPSSSDPTSCMATFSAPRNEAAPVRIPAVTSSVLAPSLDSLSGLPTGSPAGTMPPSLAPLFHLDARCFEDCYREAKRRLLMCSFRIIDEQAVTQMKSDLEEGYRQIMLALIKAPSVTRMSERPGRNFLMDYEDVGEARIGFAGAGSVRKIKDLLDEEHERTAIRRHTSIGGGEAVMRSPSSDMDEGAQMNVISKGLMVHADELGNDLTNVTGTGVQTLQMDKSEEQPSENLQEPRSHTNITPEEIDIAN